MVAGGEVSLDSQISGDLIAAGGRITIRGSVADDLRVAGGGVNLDVTIGDDLMVTGGKVSISPDSQINGEVRVAAGEVTVSGTIDGGLSVAAGRLVIGGRIAGNVDFVGDEIDLLDGVTIEGDLTYYSPQEKQFNANATIRGNLLHQESDWHHESDDFSFFFPITMMVSGVAFLLLFPVYSVDSARRPAEVPLNSAGLGLLFLVFAPIVAIICMVTVVGIWLGLALLALYAVAILAGYLVGLLFVGDWGARLLKQDLNTRWRRIASLLLAAVFMAIVSLIPLLGGLSVFVLLLCGLGAGLIQLKEKYRQAT